MSRKRGERRWGDHEAPHVLKATPPQLDREPFKRLVVKEPSIGNFEVYDQHGNVWEVVAGCDDGLDVVREPDRPYPNMRKRILSAVRRYQQENH